MSIRASFFPIDPYSAFYALFAANFVSHTVFLYRPKTQNATVDGMSSEDVCREVVIFSRKVLKDRVERTGHSRQADVPWMAGACPYGLEPQHTKNPTRDTSRKDIPFAVGVRGFFTKSQFISLPPESASDSPQAPGSHYCGCQ